jgi:hypothetical protein
LIAQEAIEKSRRTKEERQARIEKILKKKNG